MTEQVYPPRPVQREDIMEILDEIKEQLNIHTELYCPFCNGTGYEYRGDYYDPPVVCFYCDGREELGIFRYLKAQWLHKVWWNNPLRPQR